MEAFSRMNVPTSAAEISSVPTAANEKNLSGVTQDIAEGFTEANKAIVQQ